MKDRIVSALDIGTSKIVCLIAKSSPFPIPNPLELIGASCVYEHNCVSSGVIVDLEQAISCIQNVTQSAQKQAGVKLKELCVAVGTGLVKGETSKGIVVIPQGHKISHQDVHNAIEQAKANIQHPVSSIPDARDRCGVQYPVSSIIHTVPQEFFIDDYPLKIPNPVGMQGNRLTANAYIVTADNLTVQNILTAVKQADLNVSSILPQSIASSYSVIDSDEQKLGCILIDIGEGGTDAAVFYDGKLRDIFSLELGSEFITNDISIGLKLPKQTAESLKTQYGVACSELTPDETIKFPCPSLMQGTGAASVSPSVSLHVSRKFLASIIGSRIEEILFSVHRRLLLSQHSQLPTMNYELSAMNSIVLTGGTAKIKGITRLVERIFSLPVRIGSPNTLSIPTDTSISINVKDPSFASAIGLLVYAASSLDSINSINSKSMGISLKDNKTLKITRQLRTFFLE